MQSQVKMR